MSAFQKCMVVVSDELLKGLIYMDPKPPIHRDFLRVM